MAATIQYEIERHLEEGMVVLTPTGPFDEMDLEMQITQATQFVKDHPSSKGAVLNLALVSHINSKAIGMVADLASRIETLGGKLFLAHADKVSDALKICGIDAIIPIFDTLAQAKKELIQSSAPVTVAQPEKPEEETSLSFFSVGKDTGSCDIKMSSAPEIIEMEPVPETVRASAQDIQEMASTSPFFSLVENVAPVEKPKASSSKKSASKVSIPVSFVPDEKPVTEETENTSQKIVPTVKETSPSAPANIDVLMDGGLVADPLTQMRSILTNAADQLRTQLSGFDTRRKDLEEAITAKKARAAAFQADAKSLKAEVKSLEKEHARVMTAIASVQSAGV